MQASGVLVVHNPGNGFDSNQDADTPLQDVTIWMGGMYNCGEDAASRLVRDNCRSLSRFVYLPRGHKGGRMVRPHYYRSNRIETMEFPNLKTLGYWQDCGTPRNVLWITPNLQHLLVFCLPGQEENRMLEHWMVTTANENEQDTTESTARRTTRLTRLPERTAEQCPHLQAILCAVADPATPETWYIRRCLVPPRPLEWPKLRLLHLVMAMEISQAIECPLADLPQAVLGRIVSFCHAPKWKVDDFTQDDGVFVSASDPTCTLVDTCGNKWRP